MRRIASGLAFLAICATLGACGGGGGGPAANLATITSANAPQIAGAVMASTLEGGELGSFASPGAVPGTTGKTRHAIYAKVGSVPSTRTLALLEQSQLGILQAPLEPIVEQCAVDGSMTLSADLANPNMLGAGDTLTLEFEVCDDGETLVDGSFVMTVTSFSGDIVGGVFSFGVMVRITDFSVTENGETATADGDITISISATQNQSLSVSVSSSSLTVGAGGESHTLSNFSSVQTIDSVTSSYTLEASGNIASTTFAGSVNFETTVVLQGMGTGHAASGELVITGAANASIHVIVLDSQMVRLEIDIDGDGDVDESVDRSWDELV